MMSPMKWSKSWIGITLSTAALVPGCARETPVFVDLGRVRSATAGVEAPQVGAAAAIAASLEGSRATIKASTPDGPTPEAGQRAEAVMALLRQQTEQTLASLTEAYERRAMVESAGEIAELRARLRRTLTELDSELMETAEQTVRARAPERGRLLARLAFLAGFPVSRPRRSNVPWSSALDAEWAREVAELKKRIDSWDDETYALLDRMVSQHHEGREAVRAAVSAQIRELRESAREKASRDVSALLGAGGEASLGGLIADNPSPSRRASEVTADVPPLTVRLSKPEVGDRFVPASDRLDGLLDIFLRVHGYKLAGSRSAGRDATGEFIAWLKTTQNGHSES